MDKLITYTQLINHLGKRNQVIVAIEELSELQKELCKYLRDDMDLMVIMNLIIVDGQLIKNKIITKERIF